MTRLALLSDVHADVHALRDALSQVDRLGVDRVVCCGDVIDYGLFPDETIALLRERRIATVRGNHDRWALARGVDMSGWDLSEASRIPRRAAHLLTRAGRRRPGPRGPRAARGRHEGDPARRG
jgi:predicted phosphodiesterase